MPLLKMTRNVFTHDFHAHTGEIVDVEKGEADRLVKDGAARPYAEAQAEARTEVDEAREAIRKAAEEHEHEHPPTLEPAPEHEEPAS